MHGPASRLRIHGRLAAAVLLIGGIVAVPSAAAGASPPSGYVSHAPITAVDLLSGAEPVGLTVNSQYFPRQDASPADEPFQGSLKLNGATMSLLTDAPGGYQSQNILGKDTTFLPRVELSFFTHKGHLVPTTQQVIRRGVRSHTRSYWDVLVQPGRVWSQPGDRGWNRASFPFALVNSRENDTHSGIAMFLYKGSRVSHVRFQVVQQTSPWYVVEYFSAWGVTGAEYTRGDISHLARRKRAFERDLANRLPVRSWRKLGAAVTGDPVVQDRVAHPRENPDVYLSAVVQDGVVYRSRCRTAAGPFPYCDAMRHGVWSVTKSAMINVALLRLAQKYGAGILKEPIAKYLPDARRPGWRDVTFRDMANMSSGHGHAGDEEDPDYSCWYNALSEDAKTQLALSTPRHYEPGTAFNYRDRDAYLLGVAEDALLKSKEGADASIWRMLRREVYRPIGVANAPANTTLERDGSRGHPLMAFGYYPTLDDLAKIGMLYQNHGAWKGRQILHRQLVDTLLPTTTAPPPRSPDPGYYLNWRVTPVGDWYITHMQGYGGNRVSLLPRDLVGVQIGNEPYVPAEPWPIANPCNTD